MEQKIKVVFINETPDDWLEDLTLHKVYEADKSKWYRYYRIYSVTTDNKYYGVHDKKNFITLAEWRQQQIDKILEDE
jgi:hypothetical protein